MGGAGHLNMDEDGIVIGIAVKPGHGAEIVRKFIALEQVLYVCLNPGHNFLDSFPIAGLFVCHGKNLLSSKWPRTGNRSVPCGAKFRK